MVGEIDFTEEITCAIQMDDYIFIGAKAKFYSIKVFSSDLGFVT